jgi:RNA polymerase sporulation-specific sigma factor
MNDQKQTNEELALDVKSGRTEALDLLWLGTKALIRFYALRFIKAHNEKCIQCGIALDDLVQIGYFALLDAVKAFTPESPYMFNTYLRYHLLNHFYYSIGFRKGKPANDLLNNCISFDEPLDSEDKDNSGTLHDVTPDPDDDIQCFIDREHSKELHERITRCIDKMEPVERKVIQLRYNKNSIYKTIAEELGVSAYEVQNIEEKALRKLRKELRRYI